MILGTDSIILTQKQYLGFLLDVVRVRLGTSSEGGTVDFRVSSDSTGGRFRRDVRSDSVAGFDWLEPVPFPRST